MDPTESLSSDADLGDLRGRARGTSRAADPGSALDLYAQALACWRGRVLADLTARLRQHPAVVDLARRHVGAVLAYADLAIAAGLHQGAEEQVRALTAEEPLHEGAHARLMLGLEPGSELHDVQAQVLRGELPLAGAVDLTEALLLLSRANQRSFTREHSTDLDALHRVLLDPLGPDGDRRIQQAVYDKVTDIALSPPVTTAAIDAVLLFDGVFLLRKELFDRWDLRIVVSATFEKTLDRARIRDQTPLISANEVEQRYRRRYIPSQQFYFETIRPTEHADIIVYNDEPLQPAWEARTL